MITRRFLLKSLISLGALKGCGGGDRNDSMEGLLNTSTSRIVIDSIVFIDSNLTLSSKLITIKPEGGFIIRGGSLTIINSSIDIYFAGGDNASPNSAFRLIFGKFEARSSKFNAYSYEGLIDGGYLDQPAPNLIINGINQVDDYDLPRDIKLYSNEFSCHAARFIGVLSVSNHNEATETFDARRFCNFIAASNSFTGFHGVIGVGGLISAELNNNIAKRNTFIQFVLRGDDIKFNNNKILFPGNGDTGDGLNIVGTIGNCSIINNDIENGSCYGIAIYSDVIKNLMVKGNVINSGITHALLLTHKQNLNYWSNINISENIFTKNIGGVAISGLDCSKVSINKNYFQNNLKNWPSPVISYNSTIGSFNENLIFDKINKPLNRESLITLIASGIPCPPIYITGIR